MWEKATLHKDVLVKGGMSEQLLGDLAGALGEFEQTIEATRAGRREHASLRSGQVVGASADLEAVAAEIAEQVRVLDGLVRYRFGDNAELMGAWAPGMCSERSSFGSSRRQVRVRSRWVRGRML